MNRRNSSSVESALVTFGVIGLVIIVLASVHAFRTESTSLVSSGNNSGIEVDPATNTQDGAPSGGAADPTRQGGGSSDQVKNGSGGGTTGKSLAASDPGCKGGATDTGVTPDSIKLGATIVSSGLGSSFLGPVRIGMSAVVEQVNKKGGICGRKINLVLKDDGWERTRGQLFLRNLVQDEKVFALAVVPSSEGLDAAADELDADGVPVIGTDGMLVSQYTHQWFWPVATATVSLMHAIAKDAHDRGASRFSLVYDRKYRFGIEGAYAFNQAVRRLTNADIDGYSNPFQNPGCTKRFCAIEAGQSGYNSDAKTVNDACFPAGVTDNTDQRCDFNALLLEPTEALTWYNSGGPTPDAFATSGKGAGAAQPLFTRDFAQQCQKTCDKLVVWTGFNPPVERFAGLPGVQQYVADVRAQSATVDVNNQFLEGGYLGMRLTVEALRQAGSQLTRARVKSILNSITLDTGLTQPLSWKTSRFANRSAQGFKINYASGFSGWSEATNGWVDDPWVGEDLTSK